MTHTIKFTPALRDRFRETYEEATKLRQETFSFDGKEYDTQYASYLLNFLDQKFGPTTTNRSHYHG